MDYPYGYGNGNYGNGMGYQNGYSTGYANGQAMSQQRAVDNIFAWVYGDAGAKAYPVAPNKTVLLVDSEGPFEFIKSADGMGRPYPMKYYTLTEIDEQTYMQMKQQMQQNQYSQRPMISQAPQGDMAEYVKKADLESEVTKILHQNQMGGMNSGNNGYGNSPEGNQR